MTERNFYQESIEDSLQAFDVEQRQGLSTDQVEANREKYGRNELDEQEKLSAWEILWDKINDLIVYLLIAAAVLSFLTNEPIEGIAVIIAILLSVITGFVTEYTAQKSVDSLQNMGSTVAKVRRDGKVSELDAGDVVPGDILILSEGDAVAADARLLKTKNFASIESALTGESEAVDKDAEATYDEEEGIGDRLNMVFSGTAVTRGTAEAVVTETGMDTEVGKITELLQGNDKQATPLDIELDKISKVIIVAAAIAGISVLVTGLITGQPITEMLHVAVILAVAAIPEAMPAVSTITLSRGMKTMANHKALVKSLPAVETLGSTSVIASDKTGTLTENQMAVEHLILADGQEYEVSGKGYTPEGEISQDGQEVDLADNQALNDFIQYGYFASDAKLTQEDNGEYDIIGDPTDGALTVLGEKMGMTEDQLQSDGWERIDEIPFDSEAKYMAVHYDGPQEIVIMKGAPDVLFDMTELSDEEIQTWSQRNEELAEKGLRVIALASIRLDDHSGQDINTLIDDHPHELELDGLFGIIDPPRQDVKESIEMTQNAGIKVKMITGDHPKTASIIAQEIGINDSENTMTGKEIDQAHGQADFIDKIRDTAVFARVSPENKLQIVDALREEGEVVAMTGDGVNDAPALNGADIGVAMGVRGTEVAKESSDMILTDDRFSTIVDAVREGRIIFENIKKYVSFLFACNMVEITAIFLATVFLLPLPILPLHVLFLNLVIDIGPAMALAFETAEEGIMDKPPRDQDKGLMNKVFLGRILLSGLVIGLSSFVVFLIFGANDDLSLPYVQTSVFAFMAVAQLFHIFNVRETDRFGLDRTVFKNHFLVGAIIISVILLLLAVYTPFMNTVIGTEALRLETWGVIFAAAVVSTFLVYLLNKFIKRWEA
ncbi:cation-translocating P-type ATPase [Aerococcus kribbianus]|uniref:HAD-IC family P-type ATPase n=1 Tax=Aerococcus kribbianus TaxID=2999064 RepID=A0A9X3JGC8_9LACT|nr:MULTISPECIES: HAD-IC family P-type ATPase [unclassified Aerococcus]MCZ0717923.1 HAD-IC family P-type ATPase [Aerococcus sp. YH-aer221]MCZ0726210.1 HAD-IC family P-type ATPase [Aerococcus sp. YH-aer222]